MQTLMTVATLQALFDSGKPPLLLDCGFDLGDAGAGERAFLGGHLPGAQYAHLERELSGPKAAAGAASRGRHPLPDRAAFAAQAGRWGIAPGLQVLAYDAQGGPFAARAWWLLQWLGHAEVAVLDGGLQAWQAAGGALQAGPAQSPYAAQPPYPAGAAAMPTIEADALLAVLGQRPLLDARAPERYAGLSEPLDPVPGHIPGALNRFFKHNLQADGRFKPAAELRAEFEVLLPPGTRGEQLVQQCGSGVTACHNLLALAHAGLGTSTLYPGSWSEWCSDPGRPMTRA